MENGTSRPDLPEIRASDRTAAESSIPNAPRPRARLLATAVMPAKTVRRLVLNSKPIDSHSAAPALKNRPRQRPQSTKFYGSASANGLNKEKSLHEWRLFSMANACDLAGADEQKHEGEERQR